MQVHSTGTLTRTQLVGVGERVLEKLHDRDDTRTLVLDLLDRGAVLTNVGEQQGNSATALGQLQCRVDGATDGLHVVFDTKQEAGHGLTALLLARVQERRGGGLEASGDDLVDEFDGQVFVACSEGERNHAHAIFETLEVALTVEGLERVGGVVLERTQERREAELLGVRVIDQELHEST